MFRAGLDVRYISHPPSHVLKLLKALLGYFFNWQDLRIIEKLQVWYKEIIFPKRSKSELPIVCPITVGCLVRVSDEQGPSPVEPNCSLTDE